MRILQIGNMGSKLGIDSSAANQLMPLLEAQPGTDLILVRDKRVENMPHVKVIELPWYVRPLPGFLRSLFRLGQVVITAVQYRPDIIHGIHLWPPGIIAFVAAKLTGKACVITVIAGSREVHLLGKWMGRLALFCLQHSDVVVVTGKRTRQHLIKLGIRPDSVVVIPNVIKIERFRPDPSVAKRYHIVSTNRLYPVKNLGTLLQAVAIVKQAIPELKVAIGSTGPMLGTLQDKTRELGLQDTVTFLGHMDDVAQVLNSGHVFVLTSRSEGLPVNMIEAMACGIPCVVSNVGDILDVAKHGVNSLIVNDCDDAEAFASAITSILLDPHLEEKLSRNALKIRETHSIAAASSVWCSVLAGFASCGNYPTKPAERS